MTWPNQESLRRFIVDNKSSHFLESKNPCCIRQNDANSPGFIRHNAISKTSCKPTWSAKEGGAAKRKRVRHHNGLGQSKSTLQRTVEDTPGCRRLSMEVAPLRPSQPRVEAIEVYIHLRYQKGSELHVGLHEFASARCAQPVN